jgi:hypothetical protein
MLAANGQTLENAKQTQFSCLKVVVSLVMEVRCLTVLSMLEGCCHSCVDVPAAADNEFYNKECVDTDETSTYATICADLATNPAWCNDEAGNAYTEPGLWPSFDNNHDACPAVCRSNCGGGALPYCFVLGPSLTIWANLSQILLGDGASNHALTRALEWWPPLAALSARAL